MQLFYQPAIRENYYFLSPDESRHCIKVLRNKIGDIIEITDGKGRLYECSIIDDDVRKCKFDIQKVIEIQKPEYKIHIAIAPTKNMDRLEWFVEKTTEIGIDVVSYILCDNSERKHLKMERLTKKAISAMKQSMKTRLPEMKEPILLSEFLNKSTTESQKFIASVDPQNPASLHKITKKNSTYCVLIGPEGDFSRKEIDLAISKGFRKVNLGESRLRTETAGVVACHTLNLINS